MALDQDAEFEDRALGGRDERGRVSHRHHRLVKTECSRTAHHLLPLRSPCQIGGAHREHVRIHKGQEASVGPFAASRSR